jgi:hypothetical protein
MIVLQETSQSLLTLNRSLLTPHRTVLRWKQKGIFLPLMIALFVIMDKVLLKGSLQRSPAEENQFRQTLFFD